MTIYLKAGNIKINNLKMDFDILRFQQIISSKTVLITSKEDLDITTNDILKRKPEVNGRNNFGQYKSRQNDS